MIHPSYSELIDAINTNSDENDDDMVLNSRYSLVLATSKRARQLIDGAEPLVMAAPERKPLSIAIEELYKGKVKILPPGSREEAEDWEETPALKEDQEENPVLEDSNAWEEEPALEEEQA